jgi:hypothetical protein
MFGLRGALAAFAIVFTGVQFTGPERPTNEKLQPENAMTAFVNVPPHMEALLRKGCVNCHTNQTEWPWYARFAPLSWLVNEDVRKARAVFNMSEWGERYGKKPAIGATMLVSGCASMKSGRMPMPQYRLMHPDAKLSPAEVDQYCDWAKTESRRLIRRR